MVYIIFIAVSSLNAFLEQIYLSTCDIQRFSLYFFFYIYYKRETHTNNNDLIWRRRRSIYLKSKYSAIKSIRVPEKTMSRVHHITTHDVTQQDEPRGLCKHIRKYFFSSLLIYRSCLFANILFTPCVSCWRSQK